MTAGNKKKLDFRLALSAMMLLTIVVLTKNVSVSAAENTPIGKNVVADHNEEGMSVTTDKENIFINSHRYNKEGLVRAFLGLTMVNKFGRPDANYLPLYDGKRFNNEVYSPDNIKSKYPWVYPFLFEPSEYESKPLHTHKWVKPVRISLGLPNQPVRVFEEPPEGEDHSGRITKETKALVEDEVRKTAKELASVTKHDIKYVGNDDENTSNVRVVIFRPSPHSWETKYKRGGTYTSVSGGLPYFDWFAAERRILYTIPFTPDTTEQVDGYFISNKNNEIQFAVCYLSDDHDEVTLRGLVKECLARALGFQNGAVTRLAGKTTFTTSVLGGWISAPSYIHRTMPERSLEELQKLFPTPTDYSETDKYFMQTLYSDKIKVGMSQSDVYNTLMYQ